MLVDAFQFSWYAQCSTCWQRPLICFRLECRCITCMFVDPHSPAHSQLESSLSLLTHQSGLYCLDATHGVCDSGHLLFTLLAITDNRNGLPVAQWFAPKDHTAAHISTALHWVKAQCDLWNPVAFMMDDDNKGVCPPPLPPSPTVC